MEGSAVDLARMRLEYETAGLSESDMSDDPFEQFDRWFQAAVDADLYEPNAMVVSTVDRAGQPWSRYVLLKGVNDGGFEFYTNYESNKSTDLAHHPAAALTFGWLGLHRQVNIAGTVDRVADADSDGYWAVRTRGSQLGAWASAQSRSLPARSDLMAAYAEAEARFDDGDVPRPPHWGGWRIVPHTVEFWQGRTNRLHDRLRFSRTDRGTWEIRRLAP